MDALRGTDERYILNKQEFLQKAGEVGQGRENSIGYGEKQILLVQLSK